MSTPSRLFQRLGALGIVYSLLFVAANVLFGNDPAIGGSGAAVVKHFKAHRSSQVAGVFVLAAAVVAFTFFLCALRQKLEATAEGRRLSPIVTAGGAIYVVGLLIMSTLVVALGDTARYGMPAAAQTLNVLSADAWLPVVVGLSIVALGTGISGLRSGTLPKWLGWASVVLGILAVAGPLGGIAFLIAPVWTLVMAVLLFRSATPDDGSVFEAIAPTYQAAPR